MMNNIHEQNIIIKLKKERADFVHFVDISKLTNKQKKRKLVAFFHCLFLIIIIIRAPTIMIAMIIATPTPITYIST